MLDDFTPDDRYRQRNRARYDQVVPRVLAPLARGGPVCSAGCGTGYDVELLLGLGVDAWGFDPGKRALDWERRSPAARERLRMGLAREMPLGRDRFELVYAMEVIEHVGCRDGGWELLPDAADQRRAFLAACLAMCRPGGRLLLTSSNRLCPFDPGHGHHESPLTDALARRGVWLANPWHPRNFLLSAGDIRRLLDETGHRGLYRMSVLPPAPFLGLTRLNQRPALKAAVSGAMAVAGLPLLRRTPLNPVLAVLIERG